MTTVARNVGLAIRSRGANGGYGYDQSSESGRTYNELHSFMFAGSVRAVDCPTLLPHASQRTCENVQH